MLYQKRTYNRKILVHYQFIVSKVFFLCFSNQIEFSNSWVFKSNMFRNPHQPWLLYAVSWAMCMQEHFLMTIRPYRTEHSILRLIRSMFWPVMNNCPSALSRSVLELNKSRHVANKKKWTHQNHIGYTLTLCMKMTTHFCTRANKTQVMVSWNNNFSLDCYSLQWK